MHYFSNIRALITGSILGVGYLATQQPFRGRAPTDFQPQPGSPGGIPRGNSLGKARDLLESLNLPGLPVAVFPPYADGQIFSPRTGFRTSAVIFTETKSRKRRGLRELRDNIVSGISQIGSLFERFNR